MRFTESHEWIQLKGNIGTVGITEYAKRELGEIVFIELPKPGRKVKMGEEISVLESTKAAADVYAPVSGKITAINEALLKNPSSINQESSWLFQMEISDPKELDKLLSLSEYQALIS